MDDTNDNLAQCLRLKRELMTESIPLTAKMYHAMFFACHPGKVGRRLECNPAILSIEAEMQSIGIMHFPFTLATFINIAWAGGHYATCLQVMERERLLRGESNWIDIAPGVYRSIFRLASFGQLQTVQRSVELIRDRHLLAGIINRANSGDKRHRELIGLIKGCCERIGAYDLIHFLDTQR
jgi:hypothetical protein